MWMRLEGEEEEGEERDHSLETERYECTGTPREQRKRERKRAKEGYPLLRAKTVPEGLKVCRCIADGDLPFFF